MQRERIIACEVFKDELLKGLKLPEEKCIFLPQGLHRTPEVLNQELQKQIALLDLEGKTDCIYLGYGLCGNGLAGICSRRSRLVVPNSEDCIPVLHGLKYAVESEKINRTSSYYLSSGWIAYGSDAWKEYQRCLEIFDHETSYWCTKEMIKNYQRFTLINNGMPSYPRDLEYTRKMTEFYGMEYEEVQGSLDWLHSLFREEKNSLFHVVVEPGESLQAKMFACVN
ncbi:MAG: DUF1638 domain-containing protein [Desulfitobacterium hafniense]|nr:DUF1638 domain-containing protein [Desulfitobacterium hafniense]